MIFIGNELQKRMTILGLNVKELADKTFSDAKDIQAIIDNKAEFNSIDKFDLALICSVLHCTPEFFTDETVRKRDLLENTVDGGKENKESIRVKAKLQDLINDFNFLNEIILRG